MEQKAKIIIIALGVFLVVLVFLNFQTLSSKQALQREATRLSEENSAIKKDYDLISKEAKHLKEEMKSLNQELSATKKEKDEVQARYEAIEKERQELAERLKTIKSKPEPVAEPLAGLPGDTYWASILKAKTNLEMQLESIRAELKSLQLSNEQLAREKSTLDLEMNNLNLEKQDLRRQLEYNQKQIVYNQKAIDSVTLELVGEKNDKMQISDNLKAIKNENLTLRRQLKSLNNRKAELERKIDELQGENAGFKKKFDNVDILLKDKAIQIETMKKQMITGQAAPEKQGGEKNSAVELAPIVVRPQQVVIPQNEDATSLGKVLALNKENNFVIVDLGEEAGVRMGDVFKIYRDSDAIASVEVIQVRQSISACDIKEETTPIKVGDSVK